MPRKVPVALFQDVNQIIFHLCQGLKKRPSGFQTVLSTSTLKESQQETAPTTPKPKPVPVNMWCDVSRMLKPGTTLNGSYPLRTKGPDGGKINAEVRCKNNRCTPATPGPSNACMYICGRLKC